MKQSFILTAISLLVVPIVLFSCSPKKQTYNLDEIYPVSLHESIDPPESAEEWIKEKGRPVDLSGL